MMFIWIFVIGIIIYYFYYNGDTSFFKQNDASEILESRLAKGEITVEEYNEIKNTIK